MIKYINLFFFTCFLILSISAGAQTTSILKDDKHPVFYLDGKELSEQEMKSVDPKEIASLTVLKEKTAIEKYGEKGKQGVILIQTKKACRLQFQQYFGSKSEGYKDSLLKHQSDQHFVYILNDKVLTADYEGDLASITDSGLVEIRLIDAAGLAATYGIKDKALGVLISTRQSGHTMEPLQTDHDSEPAMLILSPFKTFASPEAGKQIKQWNDEFRKIPGKNNEIKEDQPVNLRKMQESLLRFVPDIDFFKQLTLISQNYLAYRFYERFPQTLILVKDTTAAPGISPLAGIAASQNMPYVLSFPEVRIVKEKKNFVAYLKVQLFEFESNSLLIDKEYRGDDSNPGFEFACKDGSLNCTLNNAIAPALSDVITAIAQNNKTLKAERALAAERATYIAKHIFHADFDRTLIDKVVGRDSTIKLGDLYHCFYSPDKNKFVGFFLSTVSGKSFDDFRKNNKDRNVKIITQKDIKDKDFFKESPQTYSYIVTGALVNGRWFYEKTKATYFTPSDDSGGKFEYLNNLQQWDFFKEASIEPDEKFWEGTLFEKIPDLKKDPNWERYKEMWEHRERENRKYVGMYELVANTLKREEDAREKQWMDSLSRVVFGPFYKTVVLGNSAERIRRNEPVLKDHLYIYNSKKTAIINPEEFIDAKGNSVIRYFVFLPSENHIFEWTYFPPYKKEKGVAENGIMKNLNTITKWNYSMDTLDDENFWNKYILYQENGSFKYLKKVN